jgi:DNA topoisomerase VI subunit B
MPPIAQEIDPHPKSLNNITLTNLLQGQGQTHGGTSSSGAGSIEKFLTSELSGITSAVAARITASLGISQKPARSLQAAHVAALIQALRDEKQIKPPSAACLSPAGEYNMRLGVLKELKPKMVATFSDKAGAHEGHPFLVEAAVSLGGTQVREGINVYRFANRIPLLFEAGADVVTQVATKRINWSSYHIDPKKDNIGVYVSIGMCKMLYDAGVRCLQAAVM